MADVSVSNPRATGTFFVALPGAVEPTDAVSPLGNLYADHGNVGESGIVRSVARDVQKKKNFGGKTVATLQNDYTETYQLTLLDDYNGTVLKTVFGEDNVEIDGDDITVDVKGDLTPRRAFGLDIKDGDYKVREYIYDGQPSLTGDVAFVHSDVIRYEVTIEAFENEQGVKARSKSGKATAPIVP